MDGVTYTYDDNGNLLSDGVYSYTYDVANRLTQVTDGSFTSEYVYNGDGVRVASIADGQRIDYVQDVAAALPQVLTARQGETVSRYLRGLGLVAEQTGSGSAAWRYHLPDALGSARQVADPTGQVVLTRSYDPFGGLNSEIGTQNSLVRYGFAGEEQDPLTGQVYLRARTYAPSTGRFLQADPLPRVPSQPNTLHRYAYAFNNPVNYVDPAGTMPFTNGAPQPISYRQNFHELAAWAGQPLAPGGVASRSANTVAGGLRAWANQSAPLARFLSRGHRGMGCGFVGLVNRAWDVADYLDYFAYDPGYALSQLGRQAQANLRQSMRELRDPNEWRRACQELKVLGREYGAILIGFTPLDILYDLASLMAGRDLLSGRELTTFDTVAILAGFFTAGLGDDILGGGGRPLRNLDDADDVATRAGREFSHLDEVTALRLSRLDDFTAGNRALLRGDDLRRALGGFDESGALGRRLSRLDEATAARLRNLDDFTGGRSGGDLWKWPEEARRLRARQAQTAKAWAQAGYDLNDPDVVSLITRGRGPISGGSVPGDIAADDRLVRLMRANGWSADEIAYYTWLRDQGLCEVYCYDAALMRRGRFVEPWDHVRPWHLQRTGREGVDVLQAAPEFKYVGSFRVNEAQDWMDKLMPRDLLLFKPTLHVNRVLGVQQGMPVFLDKWGSLPLSIKSWNEVLRLPRSYGRQDFARVEIYRLQG